MSYTPSEKPFFSTAMAEAISDTATVFSITKAATLVEALPYIDTFRGTTVVVKLGGNVLQDPDIQHTLIQDLIWMKRVGIHPVVIHGGGSAINTLLDSLNIEPQFADGLRMTDTATMDVVSMVLGGKMNSQLVNALNAAGCMAVGLTGQDQQLLTVQTKVTASGQSLGQVGTPWKVKTDLIHLLKDQGFIPVIAPIGVSEEGVPHNVNADEAAVAIAGALGAQKLVFLTDVPGVLANAEDPTSRISQLSVADIQTMKANRKLTGGMIPKLNGCVAALEGGVQQVHILDGRLPHALLLEIFTDAGVGTMVLKTSMDEITPSPEGLS